MSIEAIKQAIRDVPDFPKPGILFKDITPVLSSPKLFQASIDLLADRHAHSRIDKVAVIEARGFTFGTGVALKLGVGLALIRKPGKLPGRTISASYDLEYGSATLHTHIDAILPGERVLLVDDLLATGGTAAATAGLIEKLGGTVVEIEFLIELAFLKGREKLARWPVYAPVVY